MTRLRTVARLVALLALVGVVPAQAKRTKPQPCPGGRFLVAQGALVQGATTLQTDAIAVEGVTISIASGCPAVPGVVHATPKGTILSAKWPTCGVLRGVKLKALIVSQCTTIRGTLKARHHRPIPFVAKRSVCGDGILDPGNGEQCEPPNTATCDSHCQRLPTTSTTTSLSTSTTNTTQPTTNTTQATTTTTQPTTTTTTLACLAINTACTDPGQCCSGECIAGFCGCLGGGATCASNPQCCSDFCNDRVGSCDCFLIGDDCRFGAQSCCSGVCNGSGQCCALAGASCGSDSDCCDSQCVSGTCSCVPFGGGCLADGECCLGGPCINGACAECTTDPCGCGGQGLCETDANNSTQVCLQAQNGTISYHGLCGSDAGCPPGDACIQFPNPTNGNACVVACTSQ